MNLVLIGAALYVVLDLFQVVYWRRLIAVELLFPPLLMVICFCLGACALLVTAQLYLERNGLALGLALLLVGLILPPIVVAVLHSEKQMAVISPVAYLSYLSERDLMAGAHGEALWMLWVCPLACLAIGGLLVVLAAMRIRFLLDLREAERAAEARA
jgi:hypothetical protein